MAKQNKTICIEPEAIKKGKQLAEKSGVSFSAMVEDLINKKHDEKT